MIKQSFNSKAQEIILKLVKDRSLRSGVLGTEKTFIGGISKDVSRVNDIVKNIHPASSSEQTKNVAKRLAGKILLPAKGDDVKNIRKVMDNLMLPTPKIRLKAEDRKTVNSIFGGHELDEIKLKTKGKEKIDPLFHSMSGHNSPNVLMKEHNRIMTLPKNQTRVKKFFKQIRETDNGAKFLKENTPFEYGVSPRLSRHAIKHLTETSRKKSQIVFDNMLKKYS